MMTMLKTRIEIFWRFLLMGCYSFGGPTAHLGYFHREFVDKRKWLSAQDYADTVALCQMLPGPASSQVGMSIGLQRGGLPGAVAAFIGFTLPSALIMLALALGFGEIAKESAAMGLLHGLKLFAVAVVADALVKMGGSLCPDRPRITIAVLAAAAMLVVPGVWTQIIVIGFAALAGYLIYRGDGSVQASVKPEHVLGGKRSAMLAGILFVGGLLVLPAVVGSLGSQSVGLFDSFYRAGALVFGGGHVVLPMLQAEVVHAGGVTPEAFIVGYSAAQAVPGPMFSLAAFLGAVFGGEFSLLGGVTALLGIFVPSFLLLVMAWPFWYRLKSVPSLRTALNGINAAVVGLLLAAFYNPVMTLAITDGRDMALALLAYLLMTVWKLPLILMVPLYAGLGYFLL